MENLINDYGFNLKNVIDEARRSGNEKFAVELEKNIFNLQTCFDLIAQKHTATGGDVWNIDADYLKTLLK